MVFVEHHCYDEEADEDLDFHVHLPHDVGLHVGQ
jgi:hypothetical protein